MAEFADLVQAHAAQQRAGGQDGGQRGGRHPEQGVGREVRVVLDHQEYDDHHYGHDERQQAEEQALVGAREARAPGHVHAAQLRVLLVLGYRRRRQLLRVAAMFRRFRVTNAHVPAHHVRHTGGY